MRKFDGRVYDLKSVYMNARHFRGDDFYMVTEMVRASAKKAHGYPLLRGLTKNRFLAGFVSISFKTGGHMRLFRRRIKENIHPEKYRKLIITRQRPRKTRKLADRMIVTIRRQKA